MSLDKWVKPNKKKPKQEKQASVKTLEKKPNEFKKYILTCSKKSCNYQKTIMKKELNKKDKICPKCRAEMRIKTA